MKQLTNFSTLAKRYGQYNTIKYWSSVDAEQAYIPWYTYPAIEYLTNLDFTSKKVFEYGSGNSSLFWAERAHSVVSIEHDMQWYTKVKNAILDNQKLILHEAREDYVHAITKESVLFDIVIIDGLYRTRCAKVIESHLNKEEGFMIILDNADWYKDTAKYLRESLNLIEIDFHGFGPINNYTWTTSIFLSRNFHFKPVNDIQPHFSISAIRQSGEENA